MDKTKLKDIILKTLEKEGGAAGLKALAKAAKTSKNKLKKDLGNMSGVKQHQDGDYISTPINERPIRDKDPKGGDGPRVTGRSKVQIDLERRKKDLLGQVEDFMGFIDDIDLPPADEPIGSFPWLSLIRILAPKGGGQLPGDVVYGTGHLTASFSSNVPVVTNETEESSYHYELKEEAEEGNPDPQAPSFCHYCYKQDCYCHSGNGCVNVGNANSPCGQNPPGFTPTGVSGDLFDPSGNYVRPTRYKRPTKKLREVKEILEVMLDEKKKKKKDRCHRKADQVYGTKTSAYKSGAIVKCRKGMIWKKKK